MERKLNLFPANERRKEGREKSINYLYQRTWKILYFPRHESTQLNCHPRAIDLPRVLFVPETRKDDTFTDIRTRNQHLHPFRSICRFRVSTAATIMRRFAWPRVSLPHFAQEGWTDRRIPTPGGGWYRL